MRKRRRRPANGLFLSDSESDTDAGQEPEFEVETLLNHRDEVCPLSTGNFLILTTPLGWGEGVACAMEGVC